MDVTRLETLSDKIGGRFQFTVLLQKRVEELIKGSPPLIENAVGTYFQIALREIEEDRITLEQPISAQEAAERLLGPAPDDSEKEDA